MGANRVSNMYDVIKEYFLKIQYDQQIIQLKFHIKHVELEKKKIKNEKSKRIETLQQEVRNERRVERNEKRKRIEIIVLSSDEEEVEVNV